MTPTPAFNPHTYGPVLSALVVGDRCRPLDAGRPDKSAGQALAAATVESAFGHVRVVDDDMARCCLAAVWLLHDFLDESHKISQNIDTPTGSFWHGVMHRREGDFSNSKYWFARIGRHAALSTIGGHIQDLPVAGVAGPAAAQQTLLSRIAPAAIYDPRAMTDACQAALRTGGEYLDLCRRVQQAEWESLFDYCYRQAIDL
jgi:hypothetical protein